MKQFFKAGRYYLAIDHEKKIYRWSQNPAWRDYMPITVYNAKTMINDLKFYKYEETNKLI